MKTRKQKPETRPSGRVQQQEALRKEFCEAYGLQPDQISFDPATGEPIFDFDALSLLINALTDIPAIKVGLTKFDQLMRLAESACRITLPGQRTREFPGFAMIGEQLHDGRVITGAIQAINISRARALRVGVRSVGFDPVKFHEARKRGETIALVGSEEQDEKSIRAQIHVIAGPRGLNFIKADGNRDEYENLLASYFEGRTSSKDLTPGERAQWLGMLRAWQRGAEVKAAA